MTIYRLVISMCCLFFLLPNPAAAQAPLRTPDGKPDLQGTWSFATVTPMERPANLAGKEFFTEQEAAAYEKEVVERNNKDRRDGSAESDVSRAYNDFWWDSGTKVVKTRRTSLVIDPKDGKIPPMVPAARERQQERQAAVRGHEFDGPENRPLGARCIARDNVGPPLLPTRYNSNFQIVQAPGYVAIEAEEIHDVRIIRMDGRPHLPKNVRQWLGDSIGHWESNTLVVDTTNFTDMAPFEGAQNLHVVERFTRTGEDTILYQFTVEDPGMWTKPWSGEVPVKKISGPLWEYACHEGNYGLENTLRGARVNER